LKLIRVAVLALSLLISFPAQAIPCWIVKKAGWHAVRQTAHAGGGQSVGSRSALLLGSYKRFGALRALSDDELAEIVSGYDSPVRKLKVNGSPFLCPLWELDPDHLAPSDEDELTRLAQNIQADEDFIARLTTAAVSSERIYIPSEHVELQIYGKGWPSEEDTTLCREFHASAWEHRLEIAMRLPDTRLRRLGRRLVYFERPDLLRGIDRDNFDAEVSRRVHGGEDNFPWMTVPRALAELEQLMAAAPAAQHGIFQALREEFLTR
jgi:exodeoxyribonuclease-1